MLALPLAFVVLVSGLQNLDPRLERAAAVSGATPLRVVSKIILPLMKPSMVVAALFAFVHSFDEIVAAIFLTSTTVTTLPKLIWENLMMYIDPTISAVSTMLVLVACIAVAATQQKQRRSPV